MAIEVLRSSIKSIMGGAKVTHVTSLLRKSIKNRRFGNITRTSGTIVPRMSAVPMRVGGAPKQIMPVPMDQNPIRDGRLIMAKEKPIIRGKLLIPIKETEIARKIEAPIETR